MQTRDKKGRFTRGKSKFIVLLIIAVALVALGYFSKPETIAYKAAEPIVEIQTETINKRPQTIQELKNRVLVTLQKCEGNGNNINWDDNGAGKNRASFGELQFKVGTVQHYWEQLEGESLSDAEAVILALDPVRAWGLAERIIFDTTGGIFNWEKCANKHNLVGKVELIKEMMQEN